MGFDQDFSFGHARDIDVSQVEKTALYVHIPFCKSLCPYCPYNRIKYDEGLVAPYLAALMSEIDQYYRRLGAIEVTSIYVGGGTPTNLAGRLGMVLDMIRERFLVTGEICMETNPGDIGPEVIDLLVQHGVDLISLGVQSFDDRYLQLLGRSYQSDILDRTVDLVVSSGFKTVNLDLMFALPGQTPAELMRDLARAVGTGANQVTTYPLFCFPYSTVGKYQKLKKVKMPDLAARRRMYRSIHGYLDEQGFQQVSVWGFGRGQAPRYSSVTRDYYIGLGAGAGSHVPGSIYLNTFSVKEYMRSCCEDRLPVALKMDLSHALSAYYWLYWRLYDTRIPKEQLFELFGAHNPKLTWLLRTLSFLGMAEDTRDQVTLNERGAFWVHLAQNYFALNYINKVWSVARETPFPARINL
ncbi:MAG: coproporphyrinogen-III oxidase family protein [Bacillota bacterium]